MFPRAQRIHHLQEKTSNLQQGQNFFEFEPARAAPVCRAGGEPSNGAGVSLSSTSQFQYKCLFLSMKRPPINNLREK